MKRRNFTVMCLILLAGAILRPAPSASAQSRASGKPPRVQQKTITDAAGKVHKRPLPIRETDAQRKAVAARYKALRSKAAAQKAKSEVKK